MYKKHKEEYKRLACHLSIDPLADGGGQQVLSPYHTMGCNPAMMLDPLGLQGQTGMSSPNGNNHFVAPIGFMVEGTFVYLSADRLGTGKSIGMKRLEAYINNSMMEMAEARQQKIIAVRFAAVLAMVDGYNTALQSLVSSYDIRGMIGSQMRSAYLGEYNNHTNDGGCTGTFVYPFGPAFGTVENVLDGKEWVAYAGNCYDAATGQVIVGGGDPSGPLDAQQIMIDNAYQTKNGGDQLTLNQEGGYRTLINNLKSGKPVMIGVAYHDKPTKNHNWLTDHYITAVGMGYDASRKQNYISYYDIYGNHPTNLTINKLYFDKNGISGNGYTKNGVQYFYNVTEVRPNTGRSSKWQFWK